MCFSKGGSSPTAPVTTPGYSVKDSRASLDITDTPVGKEPQSEKLIAPTPAALTTSKSTGAAYNNLEV